jgi:DNA-binding transcriptional LysR family regulator
MDLLQLEHFLAVVEEGSFTRAAERVFRTQSAVSQSVKKLEDAVGVALIARDMPDLSLTEAGRVMAEYARKMLRLRDDAARHLSELQNLSSGTVSVAAHESAALYLLPGPVRQYLEQFPQIKVAVHRSRPEEIPRQVIDRELDVGFVKEQPHFRELQSVMIHADEMILIGSPRHRLARRQQVHVTDLSHEPFVVHHLCSSTEQMVRQLFEAHGARCRIVAELWSFENIKHFVEQDVGVAVVPRITVAQELASGAVVAIPVRELHMPRQTYMICRARGYMSECAQQFVDIASRFDWDKWVAGDTPHKPLPAPALRVIG